MGAQLAAPVHVTDPETNQTVILAAGTCPEPHLAALVTNPAAWVDGKLPRLKATAQTPPDGAGDPTGAGPGGASGDGSDPDASDQSSAGDTDKAAPAAKKTAARKTAASNRSRGRDAADEDGSGE